MVPKASLFDAVASAASGGVEAFVSATSLGANGGGGGPGTLVASLIDSIVGAVPLLGSLGVLTFVIALHEAGHLIAALSQGIRVKGYSIGFGPQLLSYRSGDVTASGEEGKAGLAGVLDRLSGPAWDWGALDDRPGKNAEGEKAPEANRRRRGRKPVKEPPVDNKGVEYTLRAIPIGGFVSFPNNYEMNPEGEITEYDDPDLLSNRGPGSRAIVVVAGVVANFLLSWACIFGTITTSGISRPHFAPGVVINQVMDDKGGAARAGFKPKDVLLSINGDSLGSDRTTLDKAVSKIRSSEGKPIAVEVVRNGAKPYVRMVQPALGPAGKYTIGVQLAPNLEYVERQQAAGPIEAAEIALKETKGMATQTLDAFVHLVSSGDTEGMSGPVEIVKTGAELASEDGATALLQFAAVISVNLAVINSLPVPGLDGGQMVFILAEILSRRKLDRAVADTINGVALLLLLTVSLSTIAGDLQISGLFQKVIAGVMTTGPPHP